MIKILLLSIICGTLVSAKEEVKGDILIRRMMELTDGVKNTKVKLAAEVDFPFKYQVDKDFGLEYTTFQFGNNNGSKDNGMKAEMFVDLNLSYTLLPGASQESEFKCEENNQCKKTSKSAIDCPNQEILWYYQDAATTKHKNFFANLKPQCDQATTFLRFTNSHETDTTLVNTFPIGLYNDASSFESKPSKGIMGIAPNSEFWKYILKDTNWITKNEDSTFGLSYTPVKSAKNLMDEKNADVWNSNSSFVVQGKKNAGNAAFYKSVLSPYLSWTIDGVKLNYGNNKVSLTQPADSLKMCVSTRYQYLLGVKDAKVSEEILGYFAKVCKDSKVDTCKESEADTSKVHSLKIEINSSDNKQKYELEIDTDDIQWWNGDKLNPIAGQHFEDASKYGCDGADIIVGRPFLAKFEALLKVEIANPDKREIGFIPNKGISVGYFIVFCVVGVALAFILVAIVIVKCICKRKNATDEYNKVTEEEIA